MGQLVLNTSAKKTFQSNMKFLALLSSAAVASAQLVHHPNGAIVPADTPAQAAAKAEHFAAKGSIPAVAPFYGYNGYNNYYPGYAGAYGYGAGYAGAYGYGAG